MADLRSGSSSTSNSCSSSKTSDDIFKQLRSRVVLAFKPPRPSYFDNRHRLGWKWQKVKKNKGDPPNPAISAALDFYNLNSVPQYQLLKPGSITPVGLPKCRLYHVNFTAKKIDVADAPKERFFAEVTRPATTMLLSVKLCISLGPRKTLSGDRLNGCFLCRDYNNVWHPKGGGFVRGAEGFYKTLKDICCDNPIPDDFPMLKQVSQACEPKKECEYPSEQVDDDTSPHATEALKFYNQTTNRSYELVKPGFATRVILPTCFLFHVNFKAKEADPTAKVELFFAELTSTDGFFSCKGCRILTKADLTQGNFTGDKTNGCYYCHDFNNVRHPQEGRFVRGGDSLYKPEEGFE